MKLLRRAGRFYTVGAIGIAVQLGTLALLRQVFGLNYLLATALAVEAALLHNFAWHERFTWRDRASGSARQVLARLLRFHATTGLISIGGNLLVMRLLVGTVHVPYILASPMAIAACSLANFAVSHLVVFRNWRSAGCVAG